MQKCLIYEDAKWRRRADWCASAIYVDVNLFFFFFFTTVSWTCFSLALDYEEINVIVFVFSVTFAHFPYGCVFFLLLFNTLCTCASFYFLFSRFVVFFSYGLQQRQDARCSSMCLRSIKWPIVLVSFVIEILFFIFTANVWSPKIPTGMESIIFH